MTVPTWLNLDAIVPTNIRARITDAAGAVTDAVGDKPAWVDEVEREAAGL